MKKAFTFLTLLFLTSVSLFAQNIQFTSTLVSPPCNDDGVGTVNITSGLEPYTVYWLRFGGETPTNPPSSDTVAIGITANNLAPGYYQIHVYDANGVQGFGGLFVPPPFVATHAVTAATCSNSDGKARIIIATNSPGPYSFVWSTGQITGPQASNEDSIVNVPAGNYSVLISNGAGCSYNYGGSASGTINQGITVWANSPITATQTATPSNCFDGTATVVPSNGTAPYSFLWNTIPAQLGETATGLAPGFYQCLITDAEGCTRNAFVTVPAGPNYLQTVATVSNPTCTQANGTINLGISGGQSPYAVLWSNGSTVQNLTGVTAGSYTATVTDNLGCVLTIYKNLVASSPINLSVTATSAACDNTGATATAAATGGQMPYTYNWSGGGNTAIIIGLASGNYYVSVADANGCAASGYVQNPLPQSCFGVIQGRVVSDLNGDCNFTNNESGIANVLINASPGYHYATTNAQGYFSISVAPGIYQVQQFVPAHFSQQCPSGDINVNVPGTGSVSSGNIFYNVPDSIFNNLRVTVNLGFARPGFQNIATIAVQNIGVTSLTPTLTYLHDSLFVYNNANPAPLSYNAGAQTLTWNVGVINPNQWKYFYVYQTLPASAVTQIGDSVHCSATVSIPGVDIDLSNNSYIASRLITGSYDPNDKAVMPEGVTEEGRIGLDVQEFFYRVRFQNTGNDTAFTVVISDTLDTDFDVASFRFDATSHPVEYEISGAGIITFTFNNILLPDSTTNEVESHGAITYYIARRSADTYGTQYTNTAYIYFDFNPPIVTNTTVNTLYDFTVGIVKNDEGLQTQVFPNPTNNLLNIVNSNLQNKAISYTLIDVSGKVIYQHTDGQNYASSKTHQIDLNALQMSQGLYMLIIRHGDKQSQVKVQKF